MKNNKKLTITALTKVLFLIILISIMFNLILLGELIKNNTEHEAVINDYHSKKNALNIQLDTGEKALEEELDQYYADKLKQIIDEEALEFLAQKQWHYMLTVNGKNVNGPITYLDDKNIKIVLAEFTDKERLLPRDILVKGTLTGGDPNDRIDAYLDVLSLADYNIYEEKEEDQKRVCYEFKNISKGTIITIKISEILKQRLQFNENVSIDDNILEIIIT